MARKLFTNAIVATALILCLSACSNPEADGKKAAEQFFEAQKEFAQDVNRGMQRFIEKFSDYKFTTRVEARQKSQEIVEKANAGYEKNLQKAQQNYTKLAGKYVSNQEKSAKFQYAYNAQAGLYNKNKEDDASARMKPQINNLILTVIPPKPDEKKIAADLVKKNLYKPENVARKKFEIKQKEEIVKVTITSQKNEGDDLVYLVHLDLKTEINAYLADARIRYKLGAFDDWTIDNIQTLELDVVRTNKYNNCIKIIKEAGGWSTHLYFQNTCDVLLLVEGKQHSSYGGEWEDFAIEVPGNSNKFVDYDAKADYKINRIERP